MSKRTFSISKLTKAVSKKVCFECDEKFVYLSDKRGCFALQTKDKNILSDLENAA